MDKLKALVAKKKAETERIGQGRKWVVQSELEELERPPAVRTLPNCWLQPVGV